MCKCDTNNYIMPSQRKRIGFLPSEEVHEIIDKLCRTNDFSQSKVTGLLVEEALRSRGILSSFFSSEKEEINDFVNKSSEQYLIFKNYKTASNGDVYSVNKKLFSEDIKMMKEFVEFKYFKRIMRQNRNILD